MPSSPAPEKKVLATIGDLLEQGFPKSVGIKGIYMTPINRAGGVKRGHKEYTPSTDGNFDPISIEIDQDLGNSIEYKRIVDLLKQQQRPYERFDLRLMSPLNDESGIPIEGKNLIIVAAVNNVLHVRIFDGDGKVVVDTDEKKRLTEQARQIEDLRKQLDGLWPPHELTRSDEGRVITAVTSIVEEKHPPIIRNLVPLHTGQGPDFFLALFGEPEYRNIYMMVEIPEEDWVDYLPPLDESWGSNDPVPTAPVSRELAEKLTKKGYIPGLIHSADAALDASQQTGWSATGKIAGIDKKATTDKVKVKDRRWVYMHYFKPSQPALNPDHPDCQALTLINGIVIDKIKRGHACGLRLDAVPFSIEKQPDTLEIWDTYTPSAVRKASQFASLIRQLGSFSFQELMAPLQEVKEFMRYGTDLTYDFFTRAPTCTRS